MKCKRNIDTYAQGWKRNFNPLVFIIAIFSSTDILTFCQVDVLYHHKHVRNAGLFFIIATFISLNVLRNFFVKISLMQRLKELIFLDYDFWNDFNIIFLSFQIDKLA